MVEDDDAAGELGDGVERVGDEQDRAALGLELCDLGQALLLEGLVAHGEDLVHQQDVRVDVHGHGERELDIHARAVDLDRVVDPLAELAELNDRVEQALGLLASGCRAARR